jgi:hypothetical protein
MGHTAAEPSTETEGEDGRLPQVSARIGSVNDGRLERLPRELILDAELRGVASELPLPAPEANGHPSLLGVPRAVKSFSIGDVTLLVLVFDDIV